MSAPFSAKIYETYAGAFSLKVFSEREKFDKVKHIRISLSKIHTYLFYWTNLAKSLKCQWQLKKGIDWWFKNQIFKLCQRKTFCLKQNFYNETTQILSFKQTFQPNFTSTFLLVKYEKNIPFKKFISTTFTVIEVH